MRSTEIKNFGIIGWPIGHSFSPKMYMAAFKDAGFNCYNYIPFPVRSGRLMLAVDGMKGLNFRGFNVTIPHKTDVMAYLDAVDADAVIIGAVNTVVNDGGILTGYNTDVTGFLASLREANFKPDGCNAVILGAGGAARAVLWGFCKRRANSITIGARNFERAKKLADDFRVYGNVQGTEWNTEDFIYSMKRADILINTTPLGMFPTVDEMPPVDLKLLPDGALVYDVVYNPIQTKLLKTATELGYLAFPGLPMLLLQGKESYRLFTGELPNLEIMRQIVDERIEGSL